MRKQPSKRRLKKIDELYGPSKTTETEERANDFYYAIQKEQASRQFYEAWAYEWG